ncbi:MAG: hypothetical protein JSU77_08695 [Fidelibacterota bacterium]|nr:MAG: hypothetical protein JSU77_08695 [Candidatus Neomarinimicrobiota bacterium]
MTEKKSEVPWLQSLDLYRTEFERESDRACVIISATMLDDALESILKGRLCPSSSYDDELLEGPQAPLATFSSRIHACHRLGLISSRLARDLHLIRKIRNQFAHNMIGCSFETPEVQNRIREIVRSTKILESLASARANYLNGPKGDFELSVSHILCHLIFVATKVEHIIPMDDEKNIYDVEFWQSTFQDLESKAKSQ